MKLFHQVTWVLIIVGALNWGLVGIFDYDLVESIFGSWSWLQSMIYILVGLSAVYEIFVHKKNCKYCSGEKGMSRTGM